MKETVALSSCVIALVLSCAALGSLVAAAKEVESEAAGSPKGFEVRWEGEMKRVHLEGDASPRVDLENVAKRADAFAIGPWAGLRGEITVLGGVPYLSSVLDGKPVVVNEWNKQAPFLVYGYVTKWKEAPLAATIQTPKDLEAYLPEAARHAGLDVDAPFPFKVLLPDGRIAYHIINNTEEGYQVSRPHDELMSRFTIEGRPATVIGVYSTKHAGVFTHHGESTHIHVVSEDGKDAGHLDDAKFGKGAKLYLPGP